MTEYAIRVFSLIAESLRQDARDMLAQASIVGLPHNEEKDRREFVNFLKEQSTHPLDLDIINDRESENAMMNLESIFSGK